MKKLLALMLVLSVASVANAALLISVDGVVDPPDTSIELFPSDTVTIDIWGDGLTPTAPVAPTPWLIVEGLGTVSGGVVIYPGTLTTITLYEEGDGSGIVEWLQSEGYNTTQSYYIELVDGTAEPPPLSGTLVDEIELHCIGFGDVLLSLVKADLSENYDTQIIHQIPEPASMLLLGLGGLLLRRRK